MVVVMSKLCGTVTMYCTWMLEYFEGLRRNNTHLDVVAMQHETMTKVAVTGLIEVVSSTSFINLVFTDDTKDYLVLDLLLLFHMMSVFSWQ